MAKKKKEAENESGQAVVDDFATDLINQLNKEHQERIAFNLGQGNAPAVVKRWIPTGSRQLDWIISDQRDGGLPEGRIVEVQGPPSCHPAGTKVLLADGTAKNVENIQVGDQVLGPDGKERNVLELHTGKDKMYDVVRPNGERFTVNENHILSLKRARSGYKSDTGKPKGKSKLGEVVNISVKEYKQKSKTFKKQHRLYRPESFEFENTKKQNLKIDPYILGILIGDGSLQEGELSITTADNEIYEAVEDYVSLLQGGNFTLKEHKKEENKASTYVIRSGLSYNKLTDDKNILRKSLRDLGLLNTKSCDKFIPHSYKVASQATRKKLLAGLIDADGYYDAVSNKYEYTTKSSVLANDIQFIVRSLGGKCSLKNKTVKENSYKRMYISGLTDLPVRLNRKKANTDKTNRNHLFSNFKLIPKGHEQYYGFALDGDQLYLLDDFTVNHNSGKSSVCYVACRNVQQMGGIVVYVDTENATSLQGLQKLGIDVEKRFVFVQTNCTEEVFSVAESAIKKARAMSKDVPVLVVWDSVANSSPKAELEGDYDQQTIGLNARTIGRGIRKIAQLIGNQNVCFLIVNQQRKNVGVMFGDDTTTPGGMAIPYATTVRIRITSTGQKQIKDKAGNPMGVHVKAKTVKNKISTPFRECCFEIHFGKGIYEHEEVFDLFREHCSNIKGPGVLCGNKYVNVEGTGGWKTLTITDADSGEIVEEKKFHKPDFGSILYSPDYKEYMEALFESSMKLHRDVTQHPTYSGIDTESEEEVRSAKAQQEE